jgi:hypothetical protein
MPSTISWRIRASLSPLYNWAVMARYSGSVLSSLLVSSR